MAKQSKKQASVYYKFINNAIGSNFHVLAVGKEACTADKSKIGPFTKNRYIMHFVVDGKGYYTIDNKTYIIGEDEFFFIPTDHKIEYYPDSICPWTYFWFEFIGENARTITELAGFNCKNPVFKTKKSSQIREILSEMVSSLDGVCDDLETISYIYKIFTILAKERKVVKPKNHADETTKMRDILTYIDNNYFDNDLTIGKVAYYFNFNPDYLSRLFKSSVGVTFTEYLLTIRMQKAQDLFNNTDYNVKTVAYETGFSDPLYFSRLYKKVFLVSPSSYRKEYTNSKKLKNNQ